MDKYNIGDSCLCWSIGDEVAPETSAKILYVYHKLKADKMISRPGVLDIVPSYKALAVHYNPFRVDIDDLTKRVERVFELSRDVFEKANENGRDIGKKNIVPVIYNGHDLQRVSKFCSLKRREVIDIHKNGEYSVAMVGFKPYFPYLTGLNQRLETPRLSSPRTKIPAGTVAIAGAQTGIYPEDSPGGWNLIGTTDPDLLKTIEPGDRVEFVEVDSL